MTEDRARAISTLFGTWSAVATAATAKRSAGANDEDANAWADCAWQRRAIWAFVKDVSRNKHDRLGFEVRRCNVLAFRSRLLVANSQASS